MKRNLYYILGLLMGLVILVVAQIPRSTLKMIACDVGQGDAILLIKGNTQVLVDGGPSEEKILSCLGEHIPFWDRQLELIVMTNTDFDHSAGLISVIERYTALQFVTSDGVGEGANVERLAAALTKSGVVVSMVEQGDLIRVGGEGEISLSVLWPPQADPQYVAILRGQTEKNEDKQILGASAKKRSINERSVVLQILEGQARILLMGDTGFQTEKELLKSGQLQQIDYLKVGHHGSKFATSQEFLEKIRPKEAIISVGQGNRYGHPTEETIKRLETEGTQIRRTDKEGTIEVIF